MNQEEMSQVTTHDEKWVPTKERVKISTTNVRLETTVPQKEDTFQVIIDVIKNSTCYKAFTISTEVPEIFMQQFWYTVKKVKEIESYEFLQANKKCLIDVEVFEKILDICPRVQGVDFVKLPDEETTFTFLLDLGYKGPLHKHPSMYVDHMHQPWRTLTSFINKCMSSKTASNDRLRKSRIDIMWGIIGKDYQEYVLPIPETMLNDRIKQSESYQMFIKYFTGQIPPKKGRGKGSQGKKIVDTTEASVDPDVALELGKSISLTEAAEEEAVTQVHVTYARIVTEPVPEPARRRPSGIAFRDTYSVSKKMSSDPSQKLMESKKTSRRQPRSGGSSEGTGVSPGVLDETTVVPSTSSEGTGSEQESEYCEEEDDDETIEWVDTHEEEEKKDDDDNKIIDLEQIDDEETDDEFMHSEEHVQDDDEETDDEFVHESGNGDEEITNEAKVDAGKTVEVKDDAKKAELPPTSSSLSVSSGFGEQFLKISSNTSLISTVKDTTDAEINSLLDIQIQSELLQQLFYPPLSVSIIPHVLLQTTTPTPSPPITTEALTITTDVREFDALTVIQLRVAKLEKDVSKLKKINHFAEALASLKSQVLMIYSVKPAPEPSKIQTSTIDLEPKFEKSASEIRKIKKEQAEKQKMPKYTIKSTDKAALKEYDQKSAFYQTMNENKSFNRNHANHALYHALMEALIKDENDMDKGVADTVKNHKRQNDDDEDDNEDPSVRPNQGKKIKRRRAKESESSMTPSTTKETSKGKALTKSSKINKSATAQEPIEEPIAKVVTDDLETTTNEDVINDADHPQDYVAPKTNNPSRDTGFKQSPSLLLLIQNGTSVKL
ncbi:hypothetical protein Tco_1530449 [Tanacetum coccineum]